jgi:hypothetical protein
LESIEQKFINRRSVKPVGNEYFWVTVIRSGKYIICGCRNSEQEASSWIYDKFPNDDSAKIWKIKSRDINAASRCIRGQRLNNNEELDQVMQHFKRKL